MSDQKSYLIVKEILNTLIGRDGVYSVQNYKENIDELIKIENYVDEYHRHESIPYKDGINTRDDLFRRKRESEIEASLIDTRSNIEAIIYQAIHDKKIKSLDDVKLLKEKWWDFRVEASSFFSWLKNNSSQKDQIILLLTSLGREFPEAWIKILNTDNKPAHKGGIGKRKRNTRELERDRHKKQIRKIAKKKWAKNKAMTIADMIRCDEINSATDGHIYAESTIRGWIKDLAPLQ